MPTSAAQAAQNARINALDGNLTAGVAAFDTFEPGDKNDTSWLTRFDRYATPNYAAYLSSHYKTQADDPSFTQATESGDTQTCGASHPAVATAYPMTSTQVTIQYLQVCSTTVGNGDDQTYYGPPAYWYARMRQVDGAWLISDLEQSTKGMRFRPGS